MKRCRCCPYSAVCLAMPVEEFWYVFYERAPRDNMLDARSWKESRFESNIRRMPKGCRVFAHHGVHR